ncbi:MAG: DUF2188 domain-containing protein [Chloroflexota bacterium]
MTKGTKRQTYDVQPAKSRSGWDVVKEGTGQTVSHHRTKPPAIDNAVAKAKQQPLGEVRIKREDGTIQDERTYRKDPYPPKG